MRSGPLFRAATACALWAAVLACAGCGAYRAGVACQAVVEKEELGRGVQVVVAAADARLSHPHQTCADCSAAYCIVIAHLISHPGDAGGALQAACAPLGPAAAAALSLPWAQRMALEPAAKLLWSLDAFACEDGGADGAKPQVEALGGGGERAERDLVRRLADLGQRSAGAFRRPSSAQEADWRALCTLCSAITALVDGVVGASAALPAGETDADAGLAYILDRWAGGLG